MHRLPKLLCLVGAMSLSLATASQAHEDTIIRLKHGELVELSIPGRPARFDEKQKVLRLGDREMRFPEALSSLFRKDGRDRLEFHGSWYHGNISDLPPYLVLQITPERRDFSYEIMFNLNNLDVLSVDVVVRESDSTSSYSIMPPEKRKELRRAVRKVANN